jgi:molybdopterin synthase catalytic subunit
MSRSSLVYRPIDAASLVAEVSGDDRGAVSLFIGTVRDTNNGRAVEGIDYASYVDMAEEELARIVSEAKDRFGVAAIVVEHRIGKLALGEASVGIAAAHVHRGPALDSVRYVIEEIKKRVPIWKMEHYTDGTRRWVDPTSPAPEARA